MTNTYSMPFTVKELWLLQSKIRHEMDGQEKWKFPPVSLAFNNQITEALLTCHIYKLNEYHLELSLGDCLAIDYNVPNDIKDNAGNLIGQEVLLKTYLARRMIEGDTEESVEPPVDLEKYRKAKESLEANRASTDDDPDH